MLKSCTNGLKYVVTMQRTPFSLLHRLKKLSAIKIQPSCCIHTETYLAFQVTSSLGKARRTREEKKFKNIIQVKPKSKYPIAQLWQGITALEIADSLNRDLDDVFQAISYLENAEFYDNPDIKINNAGAIIGIAKRLGYRVEFVSNPNETKGKNKVKDLVKRSPPDPKDLVKRPPVVAIMGHVDHGKTTLLDAFRHSSIVSGEFGGITQHIGAFIVKLPQGQITFLDTPGHAAFHTMRARGAQATDFVVLVVAADDGIMEQTVESIRFAKEADVPIIVAINKIDKPNVDIEKVKNELLAVGLQVEDFGGDVQAIPISALKKMNLDSLAEAILTQAEIMNVAGDPKGPVEGVVLETSLDTAKGKVSTALIQRGTLRKGCFIVAGTSWAKVRAMYDEHGKQLTEVTPSMPVQVMGWKSFPFAGEVILEAESEKHAREIVEYREDLKMQEKMEEDQVMIQKKAQIHLEKYRQERQARLMRGRYRKERNYFREKEIIMDTKPFVAFVLKGDVHGSVEAIMDVVNTYDRNDDCRLDVIHSGVGAVSENDVLLADSFLGFIYTFNVKVLPDAKKLADELGVKIKPFNVIYHLVADMKTEISNKLPLVDEEDVIGEASVLQEFSVNVGKKKIPVAGCKCTKGALKKNTPCKVIRNENVIYNGNKNDNRGNPINITAESTTSVLNLFAFLAKILITKPVLPFILEEENKKSIPAKYRQYIRPIKSLRHEKSDVESVKKDVECGLMVEDPEISFQPGDTIICYSSRSVPQITGWNPGF